jgi:lycopene cyclase domain-containing protein
VTYAGLGALFVAAAAMLALALTPRLRRPGRWWGACLSAAAALVVLTAVFDSLMVAADLFRYREAALLGPRVLLTPLEDLAWPLFAALALPALWEVLGTMGRLVGRQGRRRRDEPRDL